jgi:hypothetical protein
MNKYRIGYNKRKGQVGSAEHAWRVFENDKEYVFKNVKIKSESYTEIDPNGQDWNICCYGKLEIDRETSTATISP